MNKTKCALFFVAAIMSAIPMPLLKSYNQTNNKMYIALTIISYILLTFVYIILLTQYEMVEMYPFLKILSIIIVVTIGVLVYGEKLNTKNIIGIGFGILAIFLLCKN